MLLVVPSWQLWQGHYMNKVRVAVRGRIMMRFIAFERFLIISQKGETTPLCAVFHFEKVELEDHLHQVENVHHLNRLLEVVGK